MRKLAFPIAKKGEIFGCDLRVINHQSEILERMSDRGNQWIMRSPMVATWFEFLKEATYRNIIVRIVREGGAAFLMGEDMMDAKIRIKSSPSVFLETKEEVNGHRHTMSTIAFARTLLYLIESAADGPTRRDVAEEIKTFVPTTVIVDKGDHVETVRKLLRVYDDGTGFPNVRVEVDTTNGQAMSQV